MVMQISLDTKYTKYITGNYTISSHKTVTSYVFCVYWTLHKQMF
jgi:hypothetical protein